MVSLEDLSEAELDQLRKFYTKLSRLALDEDDITCTHSIDAAEENHQIKMGHYRNRKSYANGRKVKPGEKEVPANPAAKKAAAKDVSKAK